MKIVLRQATEEVLEPHWFYTVFYFDEEALGARGQCKVARVRSI